jgi:PKD repeat protein
VLISCNWWNACLILDGSLSSDPDGDALTHLWFVTPSPVPFAAGPVATNCLEVGTHTIVLTVTDTKGATDTATKTLEVLTAPLAIELLMEKVTESSLTRAIKRELLDTLRTALNHSKNENIRRTQTALDSFEKKVRAKVSATNPVAAAAWIRWSQAISEGMEKCIKAPVVKKDFPDGKKHN